MSVMNWIGMALEGRTPCTFMGNDMSYEERQREIARRKRDEDAKRRAKQPSTPDGAKR